MYEVQNIVVKGKDNPVVFKFEWYEEFEDNGLNNFTEVVVEVGDESYSTFSTPDNLIIKTSQELRLLIGGSTSLDVGYYKAKIIGYSNVYDDGYCLTSGIKLPSIKIVSGC